MKTQKHPASFIIRTKVEHHPQATYLEKKEGNRPSLVENLLRNDPPPQQPMATHFLESEGPQIPAVLTEPPVGTVIDPIDNTLKIVDRFVVLLAMMTAFIGGVVLGRLT